jgi:hypothetical protein
MWQRLLVVENWAPDKKEVKSKSNTVRVSFYAMDDPYWSDI